MKLPPPPIRFLVAVVGCWVGARTLLLWNGGAELPPLMPTAHADVPAAPAPVEPGEASAPAGEAASEGGPWQATLAPRSPPALAAIAANQASRWARLAAPRIALLGIEEPVRAAAPYAAPAMRMTYPPVAPSTAPPSPAPPHTASRWSGSAWLFVREEAGSGGLAPGGTLGGSQAGARLAYRINADARRPLAVAARLYVPLERPPGAEVALGLDWKPIARLPVHLLAERREAVGREGRSDFALTLYGGGEQRILRGRVRVEAYGQAGVVGVDRPDLFADGLIRAGTAIGPVEVGAGAWGGAQLGAARLDVGPQASIRLPVGRTVIRAAAEWRFRVAGDAAPDSGPALTLSTDF